MTENSTRAVHRTRTVTIALVFAGAAIAVTMAATVPLRADAAPTFGTIPDSLLDPTRNLLSDPIRDGELPDYIVVWGRDGTLAGYVSSEDAFGEDGSGREGNLPVVSRDLDLVGFLTPNGFLGTGERLEDVPEVTVTTVLDG